MRVASSVPRGLTQVRVRELVLDTIFIEIYISGGGKQYTGASHMYGTRLKQDWYLLPSSGLASCRVH